MDDNFISSITRYFLTNGYKTVTIREISKEFGISSKTIVKRFGNKEGLIKQSLSSRELLLFQIAKKARESTNNAIENFFILRQEIHKIVPFAQQNRNLDELNQINPLLYIKAIKDIESIVALSFQNIYQRGVAEKIFFDEMDEVTAGMLYKDLFLCLKSKDYVNDEELVKEDNLFSQIFIRGLVTEKGNKILQLNEKYINIK